MTWSPSVIRAGVLLRDNSQCIRCGAWLAAGWSCHHRQLRSQGGADTPENRIALHGSGTTGCHGWVHANRAEAEEAGWIVPSYGDPALVPVRCKSRGRILIDAEYGWRYAP